MNKARHRKTIETNAHKAFNPILMHSIMIVALVLIITGLFFKIAYLGYAPPASDTLQWRGAAEQIIEYNKSHWLKAQWTDNMFGGMPSYLISFPNQYPFIERVFALIQWFINWRILFLLFGGIGMYILLSHFKFEPLVALLGALAFALSCHAIGLIEIGHNTKFKAIMYIPWIFWGIDYLRQNKNILGIGISSMFIIQQLRENHPQISYYTYLLIAVYWVVFAIDAIRKKELKSFSFYTVLLVLSLIIGAMAVSNPYMNTVEYGKYTIRGGSGDSTGLSREYATNWSFGVGEVLSFIVPKVYGGISPYYWGPMPFTQTHMYMGIIIFFLAILSVVFVRKRIVYAFSIGSLLTILLSFGKEFPLLYNLFFKYLPGFNKFRVPATILVLIQFAFVVMAAFALDFIIKNRDNEKLKNFIKYSLFVSVGIFVIFLIGKKIFSFMPFTKPDEMQQYQPAQIAYLRNYRLDLFIKSGIQSFLILSVGLTALLGYLSKKLNKYIAISLLILLSVVDLSIVNHDHLKSETLEKEKTIFSSLEKKGVDEFLLRDQEQYRIFPLAQEFGKASWSFYHQSLGGYHGAKLKRYQDIIDNSLHAELMSGLPLNWNVINMLNTKYLIFSNKLPLPNLKEVYYDRMQNLYVYQNLEAQPRAWFVQNSEFINSPEQIFNRLNSPDFNPKYTAIVEEEINEFEFSEDASINMLEKELHSTHWVTDSPVSSFMVISELYYPAGWKIYIDGNESKIYPVNYILRGVVIPAGTHDVVMKFEADTYRKSIILAGIGLSLSLILTVVGIILVIKKRKDNGSISE
ncbi:MAG: YfhO family protein [Candidatus Cloacimonetes bacterium]|nr:YfhO family protein [Candidatus Cloacimonadota bacterium]